MSSPTIPTLGASTLARKWIFETNTGSVGTPAWTVIGGTTQATFKPDTGNFVDDSDRDSGGAGSETKTAGMASASLTVDRKVGSDGTTYDVGQEFLRVHAVGKYGPANTVSMRISEFDPEGGPRIEAYTGNFGVDWDPQGGDNKALDLVNVTLHGQGACSPITHPYPTA